MAFLPLQLRPLQLLLLGCAIATARPAEDLGTLLHLAASHEPSPPQQGGALSVDEFTSEWRGTTLVLPPVAPRFLVSHGDHDPTPQAPLLLDGENVRGELKKEKLPFNMSSAPQADTDRIIKYVSQHRPTSGSGGSWAVVGSSGNLLHSGLGEEIDKHDVVVRFNGAPTQGFQSDVGTKTSAWVCQHWGCEDILKKQMEGDIYMHFVNRESGGALDLLDTTNRSINLINPGFVQQVHEQLLHSRSQGPSTGFLGVTLALALSNTRVDVYGFGANKCAKYFDCDISHDPHRPQSQVPDPSKDYQGNGWHPFTEEAQARQMFEEQDRIKMVKQKEGQQQPADPNHNQQAPADPNNNQSPLPKDERERLEQERQEKEQKKQRENEQKRQREDQEKEAKEKEAKEKKGDQNPDKKEPDWQQTVGSQRN